MEISDNVMELIWDKLITNVGLNAITAITGILNGQALDIPEARELSSGGRRRCGAEGDKALRRSS